MSGRTVQTFSSGCGFIKFYSIGEVRFCNNGHLSAVKHGWRFWGLVRAPAVTESTTKR
jgi:hypothetical protein